MLHVPAVELSLVVDPSGTGIETKAELILEVKDWFVEKITAETGQKITRDWVNVQLTVQSRRRLALTQAYQVDISIVTLTLADAQQMQATLAGAFVAGQSPGGRLAGVIVREIVQPPTVTEALSTLFTPPSSPPPPSPSPPLPSPSPPLPPPFSHSNISTGLPPASPMWGISELQDNVASEGENYYFLALLVLMIPLCPLCFVAYYKNRYAGRESLYRKWRFSHSNPFFVSGYMPKERRDTLWAQIKAYDSTDSIADAAQKQPGATLQSAASGVAIKLNPLEVTLQSAASEVGMTPGMVDALGLDSKPVLEVRAELVPRASALGASDAAASDRYQARLDRARRTASQQDKSPDRLQSAQSGLGSPQSDLRL